MTALIENEPMDADIESDLLDISNVTHLSLHITTVKPSSGAHEGTIKFRQTNYNFKEAPPPVAMSVPTVTVTSGAAVSELVELSDLTGRFLQVFYDRTSGNGWLTVREWRKPPVFNAG